MSQVIEAAGGVIWRTTRKWRVEVLVVHRPRHGDWSLPKGKPLPGETPLETALREVREETGLRCVPGLELPTAHYVDRKGRPKLVRYWEMQHRSGGFRPNKEVDRVAWTRVDRVEALLSYDHDVAVVAGLLIETAVA